jgi:hypothetical protein
MCTHGVAGALHGDSDTATAFDGNTCFVSLGDAFPFSGTAPFSLEAWVLSTDLTFTTSVMMRETRTASDKPADGCAVLIGQFGAYIERAVNQVNVNTQLMQALPTTYAYVVAVYDGTQEIIYVNGAELSAVADGRALAAVTTELDLGAGANGTGFPLTGDLDEVAIYDHPLAADRIALHYKIGTLGPQPLTDGP